MKPALKATLVLLLLCKLFPRCPASLNLGTIERKEDTATFCEVQKLGMKNIQGEMRMKLSYCVGSSNL